MKGQATCSGPVTILGIALWRVGSVRDVLHYDYVQYLVAR